MKKSLKLMASVMTLAMLLVGCGQNEKAENVIKMGSSPGPYNELFNDAVIPILEKNGYVVENIEFRHALDANIAKLEDSVDVTVAQHVGYMDVFNEQRDTDLVAIQKIPTVPAAIFSKALTSIDQIEEGMTILIPMDEANAARAYSLMQKIGWIQLKPDVNLMKATKRDVVANPYNLEIKEIDSTLIPRLLDEADYAVVPGGVVWYGRMDPSTALAHETLLPDLYIQVVVREKNKDAKWAKAIVDAYNSKEFADYMVKNNTNNYWVIPEK